MNILKILSEEKQSLLNTRRLLMSILRKMPVYPDSLSVRCEDHKKLLKPYFEGMRAEKEAWMTGSYPKSSNFPEKLIVPTKASIYVRSKSEAIIANELYDNHIPFHYEQELELNGVIFNPDFIIPVLGDQWNAVMKFQNELRGSESQGRKLIIWEHFGMMEDKRYLTNAVYKLSNYLDAGFVPGKDLLFTFESKNAPLDSRLVSLIVAYYLQ